MAGAGREITAATPPTDWMVQINKNQSLLEKLSGKNKLADDDMLTGEIEGIVRRDASFRRIEVDKNA